MEMASLLHPDTHEWEYVIVRLMYTTCSKPELHALVCNKAGGIEWWKRDATAQLKKYVLNISSLTPLECEEYHMKAIAYMDRASWWYDETRGKHLIVVGLCLTVIIMI